MSYTCKYTEIYIYIFMYVHIEMTKAAHIAHLGKVGRMLYNLCFFPFF